MSDVLHTFSRRLDVADRIRMTDEPGWQPPYALPVERFDGSTIGLTALDELMAEFDARRRRGVWGDAPESDRWLAPRLHWALRLTRAEAADRSMWEWVATRFERYVTWRWGGKADVAEDRRRGPVHKQAFARLWWGGELFRRGDDYSPVERAFRLQDLPNSYLHRPVVRCRPLALALVDELVPRDGGEAPTADRINDVARAANIALAGEPPEAALGYPSDDLAAYLAWVAAPPTGPYDWEDLPTGPDDGGTTHASDASRELTSRCTGWAPMVAEARKSRSYRRRMAKAAAKPSTTT